MIDKKGRKVFVIIPAYNKEKSVGCVINDFPPNIVDEVIVVDGYSTDQTVTRAKDAGAIILQVKETGFGIAVNTALQYLRDKSKPEDIVVVTDAEYAYFPEQLEELIKPILMEDQELVIGSRVAEKMRSGAISLNEQLVLWIIKKLVKMSYGYVYNSPGTFRAIQLNSLKKLDLKEIKNFWQTEMLFKAVREKVRIKEVPVGFRKIQNKEGIFSSLIHFFSTVYQVMTLFFVRNH